MRPQLIGLAISIAGVAACRPSDVLSVPPPAGVTALGVLASQAGAEAVYANAKFALFGAVAGPYYTGVLTWSGLLTDELTFSGFYVTGSYANVDARESVARGGFTESGDLPWQALLNARSVILLAVPGLVRYEPSSGQSKIGEAYALAGYATLLLGENYCGGTPLDQVLAAGGLQFGAPLSTDSLLGVAVGHFDSALAHANGDAAVEGLASVGLGRALLDRGNYQAAAAAVMSVPLGFIYNTELAPSYNGFGAAIPNMWADAVSNSVDRIFNVADQEGGAGLNFISAHDPRLVLDSMTYQTSDGIYDGVIPGRWYVPTKFEADLSIIPLATGLEARLIEAEAALQNGDPSTWSVTLNALRTAAPSTYLGLPAPMDTLPSDSTTGASAVAQVNVLFRERAFWLFGTGTRLGDLRRLIRQYGRDQSTVFPTGPYANGSNPGLLPSPLPSYGTDVDLTLPTPAGLRTLGLTAITNPNYKGCLTSTKTA